MTTIKNILILILIYGSGFWILTELGDLNNDALISSPQQDFEEGNSVDTFYGYKCTQDCSGHKAGYLWAEEKDIDSDSDCGGNSKSFIEGCWAYAGTYHPSYEEDADASAKPRVRTKPKPRVRDK